MTNSHNQHMSHEVDILQKALSHVESFQKKLAAVGCLIQLKAQFSPQEYALFAEAVKAEDLEASLQKSRSGAYLPEALAYIDQDLKKAGYSFEGLAALKAALEKGAPANMLYQAGERSLEEIERAAQEGRFALSASFDPDVSAILLQDLLQELSRSLHSFTLLECEVIPDFAKPWLNLLISIIANQIQAWQEVADADNLRNGLVSILMAQDWENDPTLLSLTIKASLDALGSHLPGASQKEQQIESALQDIVNDISNESKGGTEAGEKEPEEVEEEAGPEKEPEEDVYPRPRLTWDDLEEEPSSDKVSPAAEAKAEEETSPETELEEGESQDESSLDAELEEDEDALEDLLEEGEAEDDQDEMEWGLEDEGDFQTASEAEPGVEWDYKVEEDAPSASAFQPGIEWEYETGSSWDADQEVELEQEGLEESADEGPLPSTAGEIDLDMALPPAYEMEEVDEMQLGPARLDSDFAQAQAIMAEISKLSWVRDLVFAAIAREFPSVSIPGEKKRSDAAWGHHRTYTDLKSGSLAGPSFQRFRLELEALERTSPFEKAVRVAPLYAAIVGFMQKVLINSADISKPEHAQKIWPYSQDSAQYLEGLYITCLRVQQLVEEALYKHSADHQPFVIDIFEKLGQEGDVESDASNALRMVILTFWTFLQIEIEVVMVELEMNLEAAKVMMPDNIMQGESAELIDLIDFHITRARKMSPDITRAYSIAAQLYHEESYIDLARRHMRFIRSLEKHNGQWGQWLSDLRGQMKS